MIEAISSYRELSAPTHGNSSPAALGPEVGPEKSLLRFSTAGSVDDGKSTLIGRLLYDSRSVYDDHLHSVTRNSAIDFALLTDGLRAEREQGITIDVAYRYFSTPRRKFIIADTPGHEQYTRNMATGASTADVAIVLVDARKGILSQTRRHSCIAALLGIPIVVMAVNKMDLVDFSQEVFDRHRRDLEELARHLEIPRLHCIPVSALDGDNVVHRSSRTPWYRGPALLELLEELPPAADLARVPFRLPVQRVIRPHAEFRGFAGQIAAGAIRPGDAVTVWPSGLGSRVRSIVTFDGDLDIARSPQSITLTLEDELDISRGDLITASDAPPLKSSRLAATVVWMRAEPLRAGQEVLVKHTTQIVKARILEIRNRIEIETLQVLNANELGMNAIGEVVFETSRPLLADAYRENRLTGSFIFIDPLDNATSGAGMVREALDAQIASQRSAARGVLVQLGNRADVAAELERRLLHAGALALRTRVQDPSALGRILDAGATVLAEGADRRPVLIRFGESGRQIHFEPEQDQPVERTVDRILEHIHQDIPEHIPEHTAEHVFGPTGGKR
jgi:sulfate adenylyltransferase large subunit